MQLLQRDWAPPGGFCPESVQAAVNRASPVLEHFYTETFDPYLVPNLGLVGLSLQCTGQLVPALKLAARVRSATPHALIVAGGPWCHAAGPTLLAQAAPLFAALDGFVLGEGERTLAALCAAVHERRDPASVPGFVPRGRPPGPTPAFLPPLEELPPPRFDELPFDLYPEKMVPFRTLRGCYWGRCRFCYHLHSAELNVAPEPRPHRMSEGLLEQLARLLRRVGHEHGIRRWTTADNATPPAHLLQIARALRQASLDTRWRALARFDPEFTPDLCRELAEAGCERLELGLETSSASSRARLGKGVDDPTVLRNHEAFRNAGIECAVFVLDYPSQTAGEFRASLDFVCRHHELIGHFIPLRFALGRNSRAFQHPEWFGIKPLPGANQNLDVFDLPFTAADWQCADKHRSQWDEAAVRLIHLQSQSRLDAATCCGGRASAESQDPNQSWTWVPRSGSSSPGESE